MPLSRNLGTLTSWSPLGPSGPVMRLLCLTLSYVSRNALTLALHDRQLLRQYCKAGYRNRLYQAFLRVIGFLYYALPNRLHCRVNVLFFVTLRTSLYSLLIYYVYSHSGKKPLVASSCLSVCPRLSARLPLGGFPFNLTFWHHRNYFFNFSTPCI